MISTSSLHVPSLMDLAHGYVPTRRQDLQLTAAHQRREDAASLCSFCARSCRRRLDASGCYYFQQILVTPACLVTLCRPFSPSPSIHVGCAPRVIGPVVDQTWKDGRPRRRRPVCCRYMEHDGMDAFCRYLRNVSVMQMASTPRSVFVVVGFAETVPGLHFVSVICSWSDNVSAPMVCHADACT